jgi:hypothetical protein
MSPCSFRFRGAGVLLLGLLLLAGTGCGGGASGTTHRTAPESTRPAKDTGAAPKPTTPQEHHVPGG